MRRAIQSFRRLRCFFALPVATAVMLSAALAFAPVARAEEAKKTDAPAASTAKAAPAKPAGPAVDSEKKKDVSVSEQLEFQQAKVSAEMTELEERMFRLSESLKVFEPENSSRLMIALKFAREELIVHQMKEIQDQLRAASLAESVIEQKQLLTKLERLEQLLLSSDLDFQMKLERLRQIREAMRKLDTAIREEEREKKQSQETARQEEQLKKVEQRLAALQELIERQTDHVKQDKQLAQATVGKEEKTEENHGDTEARREPATDGPSKKPGDEKAVKESESEDVKKEAATKVEGKKDAAEKPKADAPKKAGDEKDNGGAARGETGRAETPKEPAADQAAKKSDGEKAVKKSDDVKQDVARDDADKKPAGKPSSDKQPTEKAAAKEKPDAQKKPDAAPPAGEDAVARLAKEQEATREKTAALAANDKKPEEAKADPLAEAGKGMASAVDQLKQQKLAAAGPPMQESLAALKKALADGRKEQEQLKKELEAQKFAAMAKDQAGNRQLNDNISEMVRGIGDSGKSAMKDLSKSAGAMANAEGALGSRQAGAANGEQGSALESLKAAREKLAAEAEKLQEQLRADVKKRLMEGLNLMLEQQVMVRESTAQLAPRVAKGSRQAQGSVVGLSKSEGKIIALADELINMVEETEFGIALPAAMHLIRDEMAGVQASLASGDATEPVVTAEKQVEEDIKSLFAAVKQMPSKLPSKDGKGGGMRGTADQERELNRIIAELRLIRMLQLRVNKETVETDGKQQTAPGVAPALRRHIEDLSGRQEDVLDVTEKLANERGNEVSANQ